MSDFNWRNGFAVGLTVGVLGTICTSLLLETYPGETPNPDTHAKENSNVSQQDNRWWLIGRVVYMDDTAAQWLMTGLTAAAVVLVYITLRDTRRTMRDTRRIGEAQVVAYLSIEGMKVQYFDTDDGGVFKLIVSIRNTGQSPASQIQLSVKFGKDGWKTYVIDEIGGQQTHPESEIHHGIDQANVVRENGDVTLHVRAKLRYKHVFSKENFSETPQRHFYKNFRIRNNGTFDLIRPNQTLMVLEANGGDRQQG